MNRFKEFICVLFGHNFNETCTEIEDGLILIETRKCGLCGISLVDESGYKQKLKEYYKSGKG